MIDDLDAEPGGSRQDRLDRGFAAFAGETRGKRHPTEVVREFDRLERRRDRGIDPLRIKERGRIQPGIHPADLEFEPSDQREEIPTTRTVEIPGPGSLLPGGDLDAGNPQSRDGPESDAGVGGDRRQGEPEAGAGVVGTGHRPTISRRVVYDSGMNGSTPDSPDPDTPEGVHAAIESGGLRIPDPRRSTWVDAGIGGECVFRGRTRPETHPEHGSLIALDYEVHPTLAIRSLRTIARELLETLDLTVLSIRHASGLVAIGEISVEIVSVAAHRDAAFRGCRAAIDRLKRETPIWKQERWERAATWSPAATPIESTHLDPGAPA